MLDALHQELVAHVLNFVGARERVAVLLTCRNSRDAVLASKSTLLVGCRPLKESAAVQGYGVRFARGMEDSLAPENLDDHGTVAAKSIGLETQPIPQEHSCDLSVLRFFC